MKQSNITLNCLLIEIPICILLIGVYMIKDLEIGLFGFLYIPIIILQFLVWLSELRKESLHKEEKKE